ncbi:MAG: hypothetical protein AAF267_04475 [Deinococcota bacterium]
MYPCETQHLDRTQPSQVKLTGQGNGAVYCDAGSSDNSGPRQIKPVFARLVSLAVLIVLNTVSAHTNAQLPDCYLLLNDLSIALNQASEVTSTVEITSGGYEIAYNRSRFSRQGDDIDVTLIEQRGRRTTYDQDVVLTSDAVHNPAYVNDPTSAPTSTDSDSTDTLLPFDCAAHNLESHNLESHNLEPVSSPTLYHVHQEFQRGMLSASNHDMRYVLELANTTEIPVDTWHLTFQQQDNWYVLEQLSASFEIKILSIPIRGSFRVSFEDWDLPARLPVSPRERLSQASP